jgi:hypothetical protein
MRLWAKQFIYWLPRVLGILFALFVAIFALDVFGEGYGFWGTLLALFMHLIPVYLLSAALAIAWRWERAGALFFVALTLLYLVIGSGGAPLQEKLAFLWPVAVPPLVIALLFLLDWFYRVSSDRTRPQANG